MSIKTNQELIKEVCKKEVELGLDKIKVGTLCLYELIKRDVRALYLTAEGQPPMKSRMGYSNSKSLHSGIVSFFQVIKLLLFPVCRSNVFVAFQRLDKIGGLYCDKFTDPFIDVSNIGSDYIIFQKGRGGSHPKPRVHDKNVVNLDIVTIVTKLYSKACFQSLYKNHSKKYDELFDAIKLLCPSITNEEIAVLKQRLMALMLSVAFYQKLLHKLQAKRMFGPVRPLAFFYAAKSLGMKCYEMQHGITYAETLKYSGYRDECTTPDLFLAFGENDPLDVYGIEIDRICNVGWPLSNYIEKSCSIKQYGKMDVLVVSDPEVSESMVKAVHFLAESNPDAHFYVRPHPHEEWNQSVVNIINSLPNIHVQDKSINMIETLLGFDCIIGENSTGLYEARAYGKKVGKLFFEGLVPKYLVPEDRECFFEIHSNDDFTTFLKSYGTEKREKSIYSPFNQELFNSLLN